MNYRTIYHDDKKKLVELFVGKSVKKVDDDRLVLSDGTTLQIVPNDGGCSCGAGDYELAELNECENIITNIEVESIEMGGGYDPGTSYHLFVYTGHRKINLLTVQGNDGNGFYGTGFWIQVYKPQGVVE